MDFLNNERKRAAPWFIPISSVPEPFLTGFQQGHLPIQLKRREPPRRRDGTRAHQTPVHRLWCRRCPVNRGQDPIVQVLSDGSSP